MPFTTTIINMNRDIQRTNAVEIEYANTISDYSEKEKTITPDGSNDNSDSESTVAESSEGEGMVIDLTEDKGNFLQENLLYKLLY